MVYSKYASNVALTSMCCEKLQNQIFGYILHNSSLDLIFPVQIPIIELFYLCHRTFFCGEIFPPKAFDEVGNSPFYWATLSIWRPSQQSKSLYISPAVSHVLKSDNLQYNTLGHWVDGTNESSTKRLMFQVLFFLDFL